MTYFPLFFAALGLALMWVLVVMPQQKRVKEHNEVIRTLAVGAEVLTTSGMCGRIVGLDDDFAELEVAPGVVLRFDRRAIGGLLDAPSTTESNLDTGDDPSPSQPPTGTDG